MKKLTAIFFTLVFILTISTAALAADNQSSETIPPVENANMSDAETDMYELDAAADTNNDVPRLSDGVAGEGDISSLLDYWNINGWPDDVSFAYEAGGEMAEDGTILAYWEIGLVNASEARKREIVELFAPTCLITFHDAVWSHAEREEVLFEIESEIKASHDRNFVRGDLIKNTEKICVVVKDEAFEEYSARYSERYGDLVWTQRESEMAEDVVYDMGLGMNAGSTQTKRNTWFIPILLAFALAAAAMFWNRRFRLVPAKQIVTGTVETDAKPLSRAQTIQAVHESTYSPGNKVLENIRDELKR